MSQDPNYPITKGAAKSHAGGEPMNNAAEGSGLFGRLFKRKPKEMVIYVSGREVPKKPIGQLVVNMAGVRGQRRQWQLESTKREEVAHVPQDTGPVYEDRYDVQDNYADDAEYDSDAPDAEVYIPNVLPSDPDRILDTTSEHDLVSQGRTSLYDVTMRGNRLVLKRRLTEE